MFVRFTRIFLFLFGIYLKLSTSFKRELFLKEDHATVNIEFVEAVHSIIENVFIRRFSTVNVITSVENPRDVYFQDFKV